MKTKEQFIPAQKRWQEICEDWAQSGMSVSQYCREKNIPRVQFMSWREKINFPFLKRPKGISHNWEKIIKDWEKSGLNIKTYCEMKNISSRSLCKRRYKIGHSSYMNLQETTHKWREIIRDWEASGLGPSAYAMKNALNLSSLRRWDKKLNPHKIQQTSQEKALQKWTKIMKEWESSGLTGFTYCRRNGIEVSCFYKWQKKLNFLSPPPLHLDFKDRPEVSLEDYFLQVPFSSGILMGSSPPSKKIEVVLPQGHQLCMEGQFDEENLSSWLALLLTFKNNSEKEA